MRAQPAPRTLFTSAPPSSRRCHPPAHPRLAPTPRTGDFRRCSRIPSRKPSRPVAVDHPQPRPRDRSASIERFLDVVDRLVEPLADDVDFPDGPLPDWRRAATGSRWLGHGRRFPRPDRLPPSGSGLPSGSSSARAHPHAACRPSRAMRPVAFERRRPSPRRRAAPRSARVRRARARGSGSPPRLRARPRRAPARRRGRVARRPRSAERRRPARSRDASRSDRGELLVDAFRASCSRAPSRSPPALPRAAFARARRELVASRASRLSRLASRPARSLRELRARRAAAARAPASASASAHSRRRHASPSMLDGALEDGLGGSPCSFATESARLRPARPGWSR